MNKKNPTKTELIKENERLQRKINRFENITAKLAAQIPDPAFVSALGIKNAETFAPYENLPVAYQSLDSKGNFVYVNSAWLLLFGYSPQDVIGEPFDKFITEEYKKNFKKSFNRFKKIGHVNVKFDLIRKDKSRIHTAVSGKIEYDKKGRFVKTHCLVHDFSEEINYQEKIRQERDIAQKYFNIAGSIIIVLDVKGRVVSINDKGCKILGYKRDDIVGKNWFSNFLTGKNQRATKKIFNEIISAQIEIEKEYESAIIDNRGNERIILWNNSILRGPEGNINGFMSSGNDITQLKETLITLGESENKFRKLFESAKDGISYVDMFGKILEVNKAAENFYGGKREDMLGKYFYELGVLNKIDLSVLMRNFKNHKLHMNKPTTLSILNKMNKSLIIESSSSPIELSKNDKGLLVISRDITEQQKVSDALRESESKYRAIFNASPLGIFHFDTDLIITHCNDQFVKIIGSSTEVLIGFDMNANLKDTKILAALRNALTTGSGYYEDYYTSITARKVTPVRALFNATYSEDKKIIGGVGMIEDITERKKAELELKHSEARFKELADSLPQMVFESDLKGKLTFANKITFNVMGYTEKDLEKGFNVFSILLPEYREIGKKNFKQSLLGQVKGGNEYYAKKKNGNVFPIEIYSSPIHKDNRTVGLRGVIYDITERKKTEDAIKKSEEKFFTIFNNAPDGIAYLDTQGNVLEINPAITKITKLTRDDVVGKNIFNMAKDMVTENDYEKVNHAIKQIASGKSVDSFQINYKNKVLEITVPSKSKKGGLTAIFRDITKRKNVEKELILNSKRQELVLESLPVMFYTGDPDNELSTTWISHQVEEITGFPVETFLTNKSFWTSRLHPDHRERVLDEYFSVFEKDYIITEYKWLCADGKYQWFVDRVILTRDEKNNPKEAIGLWLNISDTKKAQEELDERNKLNRLRADFWELASRRTITLDELLNNLLEKVGIALDISRVSYLELDESGTDFVIRNQWCLPEFGQTNGVKIPVKIAKHYYGNSLVDIPRELKRISKAFALPLLTHHKIKSYLIVACGDVNNPTSLFTISDCKIRRDWTLLEKEILKELARIFDTLAKQFRFEDALRVSEEKYRDIVTWAPIGIYQSMVDGRFITVNASLAKILGYEDVAELMNHSLSNDIYYSSGERQKLIKEYDRTGASSVKNLEVLWKKKDGSPIWVLLTSHAIRNVKGKTIRYEGFVVDISESKKAEEALKESEATLRTFINAIPETAMLIDADMDLLAINQEMMNNIQKDPNELIGRKINECLPDRVSKQRIREIKKVIDSGKPIQFEDERDGRYYMNYLNPILDARGKTSKVSIFAFNLTERKMIEKTILQAKEEAEKSSRLKSEFLAQMSHEIRTPINTILSFTGLIESNIHDQLDPELRDGFGIIHSASKRVTRTIDLILNMSEIQTGTYDYAPKKIDIYSDVLDKLANEFSSAAKQKGLELIINKNTNQSDIIADEYSIMQVFANLIDNAIKYTKKGSITVDLSRGKNNKLIAKVSDTGIGISKKYLPQLFEPFSQETQGYTRKFEGNGLGLALVKKYCEYNNAEIKVESTKIKGTTFTIIFDSK